MEKGSGQWSLLCSLFMNDDDDALPMASHSNKTLYSAFVRDLSRRKLSQDKTMESDAKLPLNFTRIEFNAKANINH